MKSPANAMAAAPLPSVRSTFVAPVRPLPCAVRSTLRYTRATTIPVGIEPNRYPTTAAMTACSGVVRPDSPVRLPTTLYAGHAATPGGGQCWRLGDRFGGPARQRWPRRALVVPPPDAG